MEKERPISEYEDEFLIKLYQEMQRIRAVEMELDELVSGGEIPGDAHLCIGQEGVAVGACMALEDGDLIAGTHRSHGHVLAKGVSTKELMAEFGGRATGISSGRGGEMHLFSSEHGVLETTGVVGGHLPHLAGAILACEMDGKDIVGMVFLGEGATNQGLCFETLNIASIWDLPLVFVCENNKYAVSTHWEETIAGDRITDRADSLNIATEFVDGQNVLEVYDSISETVERARRNKTPQFIECDTYRYTGHYSKEQYVMANQPYRSDEEIDHWRESRDPIKSFVDKLNRSGLLDAQERKKIDEKIAKEIEEAVRYMRQSEPRSQKQAFDFVYASHENYPSIPVRGFR